MKKLTTKEAEILSIILDYLDPIFSEYGFKGEFTIFHLVEMSGKKESIIRRGVMGLRTKEWIASVHGEFSGWYTLTFIK